MSSSATGSALCLSRPSRPPRATPRRSREPSKPKPKNENPVRILFIGDIFGSPGRRIVADHLQDIVKAQGIDLAIANAENSAGGFGVTPAIAEDLFALGLDVLTSGNHIWDKREIYDYLGRTPRLLRPHNYPPGSPGSGIAIVKQCAILNLQGRTYMPNTDCPFRAADQLLAELDAAVKGRFVDFHAEGTSEKIAMGWYLGGRVSAGNRTPTHATPAGKRRFAWGRAGLSAMGSDVH